MPVHVYTDMSVQFLEVHVMSESVGASTGPALRSRCNAKISHTPGRLARAAACGEAHLRAYLKRDRCKNWPLKGKHRCRYHGGRSTGHKPSAQQLGVAAVQARDDVHGVQERLAASQGQ